MEYTFLDDIERMHTVAFYQSYYYGTGEKSELIKHLERFPMHIEWLFHEVMFFMKNDGVTARYGGENAAMIDIRDDQIFQYFMTGTDEANTYYDEPSLANYPDRIIDIAEFMSSMIVVICLCITRENGSLRPSFTGETDPCV